jgi:hypothetical protein
MEQYANRKRVARLMRVHGLQVRPRRRYVATADSDHDSPIFPNLAKDIVPDGPDQLYQGSTIPAVTACLSAMIPRVKDASKLPAASLIHSSMAFAALHRIIN